MKANYLLKNRFRHPHFKRIIVLVGIFVFGAVVLSFFDSFIISATAPVWQMENAVIRNLHNGVGWFNSKKALVEENAMLQEKIYSLELRTLSSLNNSAQENMLLALAGRRPVPEMIVSAVLTHPPQTPYDIIIIDAGSNERVVVGAEVFLPEGPALGSVSEVFSREAKVKLFSSAGEETNAILERDGVPVTLVGAGGGNFKLTLPRDIAVEIGDRILSPGIVPHLLAIVGEVDIRPTDSFKEVLAKSPANIFTIRFVFVTP